jgi:hypothetical protein
MEWLDTIGNVRVYYGQAADSRRKGAVMGDKSNLCLWCGRFTEKKGSDGLAECDRPDCIANRVEAEDDE